MNSNAPAAVGRWFVSSKGREILLTIALNRHFFEWREGAISDPDIISRWRSDDLLSWKKISARRRVVILAEAALRRLEEMQHDLLRSDFAQGATVKGLPDETAVQNWITDRLRLKQGRAYSVEREPHVVDEKEPDVRLRAKVSDASLAIEIKVPESWTLEDLEVALTDQLCGRYLRARDARHGILLLVHKKARLKGWQDTETGAFLTFTEVVNRLQTLAARISGTGQTPQPDIAVLDVTSCGTSA
jgi:hypothetical protein